MRRWLLLLSLYVSPGIAADAVTLTAEEWARPRSGESLTQFPELAQVLRTFDAGAGRTIVIAHATGEAGQLWAAELRSWLVALGVSSARIRLDAQPELSGVVILEVRDGGGS